MIPRALAVTIALLALTAAPAHADRVLSSEKGGREGVGVSDNRLIGWAFIDGGRRVGVFTDSKRDVRFRCTAGLPGRRFVMRAVIHDNQVPAFFKTRDSGARVGNMACTAARL